jgi:hypothetical protein
MQWLSILLTDLRTRRNKHQTKRLGRIGIDLNNYQKTLQRSPAYTVIPFVGPQA